MQSRVLGLGDTKRGERTVVVAAKCVCLPAAVRLCTLEDILSVVLSLWPPHFHPFFPIHVACFEPLKRVIVVTANTSQWFVLMCLQMHMHTECVS